MTMGLGVVLVVIGAILTYALHITVSWVDLRLVGYILMVAGVIVFIVGLIRFFVHRRAVGTSRSYVDPATGDRVAREERVLPPDDAV